MKKKTMRIITLVWGAVIVAMASSTATLLIAGRADDARWVTQKQYDTIRRYARLDEVRDRLMSDYYQELDEEALLLGAIRGMTGAVDDPYTFYYTPEEMKKSQENSDGAYHGIGTLVQQGEGDRIQVIRVYPDTPAEQAGIQVGDVIVAVDGTELDGQEGRTYTDGVAMMRGEDGTEVTLTLIRGGETLEVAVRRGDVKLSYGSYVLLEDGIGYLSVTQFTGDAQKRFEEALDYFKSNGARGMVLDLRNNPGGLLDQVVAMADKLLPKGTIVYIQDRAGARTNYYSDEKFYDIPLAVLVNGSSASASEIMASSVQCFGRGTVVGTTTYGKGIVQTLHTFSADGAGMQLTTASYFDGSDRSIHKTGVTPDIVIEFEGDGIPLDPDPAADNQLAAAIEDVKRQIKARSAKTE